MSTGFGESFARADVLFFVKNQMHKLTRARATIAATTAGRRLFRESGRALLLGLGEADAREPTGIEVEVGALVLSAGDEDLGVAPRGAELADPCATSGAAAASIEGRSERVAAPRSTSLTGALADVTGASESSVAAGFSGSVVGARAALIGSRCSR